MTLTVSIIVHDDFSCIVDCLTSLFDSEDTLEFEVYVTINRGDPAQIDALRNAFPAIHYIINESPRGFAANHNHALVLASTSYVALLNDDILIEPGALMTMIQYLEEHPKVALVGPYLLMPDGTPEAAAYSDPSLLRMLYRISGLSALTRQGSVLRALFVRLGVRRLLGIDSLNLSRETRQVDVVVGTAMVVRHAAYEAVGPMDESTLAYGEDVDWCYRFRQQGWPVAVVADATITHFGSGQIQGQLRGPIFIESQKGIINFFVKHRPRWQSLVIRLSMIISYGARGIILLPISRLRAQMFFSAARMAAAWLAPIAANHQFEVPDEDSA